ncbi:MAG: hypothetical protein MZU97_06685 [Bacillus subtilis]|nr:hypothetical protein [Bacillus subtilis]
MTQYGDDVRALPVAFEPQTLEQHASASTSPRSACTQLRIAETEKYAHVTFFFNGGVEDVYPGEDRVLVPSPEGRDLRPEARDERARGHRQAGRGDRRAASTTSIVCNYANGDMVGHTGVLDGRRSRRSRRVDACVGRRRRRGPRGRRRRADHRRPRQLRRRCIDPATGQPHTAHTLNLVPFVYVGRPAQLGAGTARSADVAPTMLELLGLEQPAEMTGPVDDYPFLGSKTTIRTCKNPI